MNRDRVCAFASSGSLRNFSRELRLNVGEQIGLVEEVLFFYQTYLDNRNDTIANESEQRSRKSGRADS